MSRRFIELDRGQWAERRAATPLTLTEADLVELRGVHDEVSLDEVAAVHLPLARLLNRRFSERRELSDPPEVFLEVPVRPSPFVVAIAGSVAVGKTTFARVLQALLARWPEHRRVELVATDGFLHPNAVLEARGLMMRKGFPESYDTARLVGFLDAVKQGEPHVAAPVYSHVTYDVVADECQLVESPDLMIIEGLNLLTPDASKPSGRVVASDFVDFSIYLDAEEADIRSWFVERFLILRRAAFTDEASFFRHFAALSEPDAVAAAEGIWDAVNGPNLAENILGTREQADLIVELDADHRMQNMRLRRS